MRIALVSRKLDISGGGSNHSLYLLAKQLSKNGHSIDLITINSHRNNIKGFPGSVTEYNLSRSRVSELLGTHNILNTHDNYDIFHIFSPGLIPGAGLYRLHGKTPVVARLNSYQSFCTNMDKMRGECYLKCSSKKKFSHDKGGWERKIKKIPEYIARTHFVPRLANRLDRLFAISPVVKNIYQANGYHSIEIVPNFYDPTLGSTKTGEIETDVPRVLYVGRLEELKGVDLLLKAISQIMSSVVVDIVGEGSQRQSLEQLAVSLGIDEKVNFHGWIEHENLAQFYMCADVFVHPGRWPEPFGRTILESMQFDTPCIVSNVGAPPWIVGQAGLVFEQDNSDDLAKNLQKYFTDKELQRTLQGHCSERTIEFKPDSVTRTVEKVYANILDK